MRASLLVLLTSCGTGNSPQISTNTNFITGSSWATCQAKEVGDGIIVECNGTFFKISHGQDGQDEINGGNGQDGESCIVTDLGTSIEIDCNGTIVHCGCCSICTWE